MPSDTTFWQLWPFRYCHCMHMTCLHTRSTSGSTTSSTAANLLLQPASSSSCGGLSGTSWGYKKYFSRQIIPSAIPPCKTHLAQKNRTTKVIRPFNYLSGRLFAKEILNEFCNLRFVNLSSNNYTVLVYKDILRDISYIVHLAYLIVPVFKV